MRRFLHIGIGVSGVVLLLGVLLYGVYAVTQQVPEFYRAALALRAEDQAAASDELLQHAAALAGDVHDVGRWKALFTAQQINGWMAVELLQDHPRLLPSDVHNPRLDIRGQEATLAYRYESGKLSTVLSLSFNVYLNEPNVVAIRVLRARAGRLPIPLTKILEGISQAAISLELPLEWRQAQGDPVALITIPGAHDSGDREIRLETVELLKGELYVAGVTEKRRRLPPTSEPPTPTEPSTPVALSDSDHPEVPEVAQKDASPRVASDPDADEKENVQR